MLRYLVAATAVAIFACCLPDQAVAQHGHGFCKGGVNHAYGGRYFRANSGINGLGFYSYFPNSYNSFHRPYNLPYFAQHPPVHYSREIVRRPYGVSPYAAPSGVVPVEMQVQLPPSNPVKIVNPYVEQAPEVAPADGESDESGENKAPGKNDA